MCARSIIWKLYKISMWSHATKKDYLEENYAFFLKTDFSQTTLVVVKFSTTSKLPETLHNFMISVTIAVWLNKDKLSL